MLEDIALSMQAQLVANILFCAFYGPRSCISYRVLSAAHPVKQVLEDIALSAQTQLVAKIPFCAFNGGNDVFVDVGNKSLGLGALMGFLGIQVSWHLGGLR